MPKITHARLQELVHYDPDTGIFTWKVNRKGPARKGMIVGNSMKNEYRQTQVDGEKFLLHRLAWFYMTKEWPTKDIDHINRKPWDNRWENLREASMTENLGNQRLSIRNKSGYKGVYFDANYGLFLASIGFKNKQYYLGRYSTAEEAHEVYKEAALRLFGEFAAPSVTYMG